MPQLLTFPVGNAKIEIARDPSGTAIGERNDFGGELVRVRWDDGEERYMSPYWIRREGLRGGYRPLKRKEPTFPNSNSE